ncbi:MAG: methyltransferase domain-containing protein [Saprospiraceae bacterium]|nr:methyltransferase domain-containing protein [Saprospiraceae bacterium]
MTNNLDHKKKWNDRYLTKSNDQLEPELFLVEHLAYFKPGSVLDIACGDGRNSIFLAQRGFKVISLDFSEVALNHLIKIADEKNLGIETIELDLSREEGLSKFKNIDNIMVIHFKLNEELLTQIPNLLNPGGLLLYYTYSLRQSEAGSFPQGYCLKEAELLDRKWSLQLLNYTSHETSNGFHDGYLFRK